MNRIINVAAAVLLVAAAALVFRVVRMSARYDAAEVAWNAKADSALAYAALESARADSAAQEADYFEAKAELNAKLADERGRAVRERVVEVRAVEVPDTCVTFVAPRDSLIDSAIEEADTWRAAYEDEHTANLWLHTANASLTAVNDTLTLTLQSRPKPRPSWMPRVGVGPFVGVCPNGVCAGVGITLSWSIF